MKRIATILLGATVGMTAFAANYVATPASATWPGTTFKKIEIEFPGTVTLPADGPYVSLSFDKNSTTKYEYKFNGTGKGKVEADYNALIISWSGNTLNPSKDGSVHMMAPKPMEGGEAVFTIPAGSYLIDGVAGEEIVLTYPMSKTEPVNVFEYTATPAAGEVEKLNDFKLDFGAGNTPEWAATGTIVLYSGTSNSGATFSKGVDGSSLTLSLNSEVAKAGEYELYVPKGSYLVNGKPGDTISVKYTIAQSALPEPQDVVFTLTPNPFDVQTAIKKFTLHCEGPVEFLDDNKGNCMFSYTSAADAETQTDNWFANGNKPVFGYGGADGNDMIFACTNSTGIAQGNAISYGGTFAGGWVYFYIKEGVFTVNGVPNKAISLKYYVSNGEPEFFTHDTTKEGNATTFSGVTYEFWNTTSDIVLAEGAKGLLTLDGAPVDAEVNLTVDGEFLKATIEPAQTLPGDYKLMVPAGSFSIEGLNNIAYVEDYSIEASEGYYTVTPAESDKVESSTGLQDFAISFRNNDEVAFVLPQLFYENELQNVAVSLYAEGNTLNVNYEELFKGIGKYRLVVPAGSYTLNGNPGAELTMEWTVTDESSVSMVAAGQENVTVYDLQGRLVMKDAKREQLKGLKGVYIVNGEKYVMR